MKKKKTLIGFNVFYAPKSYGGATIVAEQTHRLLAEQHDWEIIVVTTFNQPKLTAYHIKRYAYENVTVLAINLPHKEGYVASYDNMKVAKLVGQFIKVYQPDVAHLHSIQGLGATFIDELSKRKIPTALTLHDCWWICDRQFMINQAGKYCFQKKIDPMVCLHCVDDFEAYHEKQQYLNRMLQKVDLFMYPSAFHRGMHILNDLPEEKSFVNKNGIKLPQSGYKKERSDVVRFGFLGGPGVIKGANLIKEVFQDLPFSNFELLLVDAAQNNNKSWKHNYEEFKMNGKLKIVPAFTQDTMDDYYNKIDVLLFPSQWKESFGLTVREALVRDVFIISTNGGGTVEDLVEEDNAYIIPISNDSHFLRDAVTKCFDRNWSNYTNKHKHKIITYEDQSKELNELLTNLITENN